MSTPSTIQPLQHVAVIMDGNGRWAKQRDLPRHEGHQRGLEAARNAVRACARRKIPYLTLFAFSRENWGRPEEEVNALLSLFGSAAKKFGSELASNGVSVKFIGQRERFPAALRGAMASLEHLTAGGTTLNLTVAVSYSGRWDVMQAAASIASNGGDFSEDNFTRHLATGDLPPVDLLVRTGGEHRISNFMLWQAAYAELYFSPALWPDFGEDDFYAAADEYSRRERRFGKC